MHIKGISSRQAHVALPEGTFEEEHGRDGFFGKASHLYRTHAPTGWTRIEGPLRPHLLDLNKLEPADKRDAAGGPIRFMKNNDVAFWVSRRSAEMPHYFRNADADEVHFVHRGSGIFETDYGRLPFDRGEYIVIPRGTTYRVLPSTTDNFFLIIESFSEVNPPTALQKGLIGQHALYDEGVIDTPEPAPVADSNGREWEVRIRRLGEITKVFYPFNPMDVVGWKGDLTVWKIAMKDIRPVMSHRAHLPPSAHTTMLMQNAVICSFLPRPLEEDPEALKVPFFHRNIDYDEVLFYHDGEFFSRDNVGPGMLSLHPIGVHHGPHPKALKAQGSKTHTNEYAVMLDARNPLSLTTEGEGVEFAEYWKSWQEGK
jgi:homogentisate 1,2-dioxygenase